MGDNISQMTDNGLKQATIRELKVDKSEIEQIAQDEGISMNKEEIITCVKDINSAVDTNASTLNKLPEKSKWEIKGRMRNTFIQKLRTGNKVSARDVSNAVVNAKLDDIKNDNLTQETERLQSDKKQLENQRREYNDLKAEFKSKLKKECLINQDNLKNPNGIQKEFKKYIETYNENKKIFIEYLKESSIGIGEAATFKGIGDEKNKSAQEKNNDQIKNIGTNTANSYYEMANQAKDISRKYISNIHEEYLNNINSLKDEESCLKMAFPKLIEENNEQYKVKNEEIEKHIKNCEKQKSELDDIKIKNLEKQFEDIKLQIENELVKLNERIKENEQKIKQIEEEKQKIINEIGGDPKEKLKEIKETIQKIEYLEKKQKSGLTLTKNEIDFLEKNSNNLQVFKNQEKALDGSIVFIGNLETEKTKIIEENTTIKIDIESINSALNSTKNNFNKISSEYKKASENLASNLISLKNQKNQLKIIFDTTNTSYIEREKKINEILNTCENEQGNIYNGIHIQIQKELSEITGRTNMNNVLVIIEGLVKATEYTEEIIKENSFKEEKIIGPNIKDYGDAYFNVNFDNLFIKFDTKNIISEFQLLVFQLQKILENLQKINKQYNLQGGSTSIVASNKGQKTGTGKTYSLQAILEMLKNAKIGEILPVEGLENISIEKTSDYEVKIALKGNELNAKKVETNKLGCYLKCTEITQKYCPLLQNNIQDILDANNIYFPSPSKNYISLDNDKTFNQWRFLKIIAKIMDIEIPQTYDPEPILNALDNSSDLKKITYPANKLAEKGIINKTDLSKINIITLKNYIKQIP
ncbi:MAG: hypothetical protein PHO80_03035 [Candidatus Gracilibacteria bacterium]|nr:hypothetical protein [Candidatus Gracilibacteria bacterium]